MRTNWMKLCPYRQGSSMRTVFSVLARSRTPLAAREVVRRSKIKATTARNHLSAMTNPFHCSSLRRAGVAVVRSEDGYALQACEADPNAKRPAPKKKRTRR